jgi:hypothetical protein
MHKEAVKDLLYGGLLELLRNDKFYYCSSVGSNYNHFTEDGKQSTNAFLMQMSALILIAENEITDKRAKAMVLSELTKS